MQLFRSCILITLFGLWLCIGCERETPMPNLVSDTDLPEVTERTPTFRNKSIETIPPYTEIIYGPQNQTWGPDVPFKWIGHDDDGTVVSYEYMWTSDVQYNWEFGDGPVQHLPELIAWIDTLTYRPDAPGHYSDERIWKETEADSVTLMGMPAGGNYYFAVRAIDNFGEKEALLEIDANVRVFAVALDLDGPRIHLTSNIAGTWHTEEPDLEREVFAGNGFHFRWTGGPGPSGADVEGFSYAVNDSSDWSPFSLNSTEYPIQIPGDPEELWVPGSGAATFFVRAIDAAGFIRALPARLRVFEGPRECAPQNRFILAVLDTDPSSIQENGTWPIEYREVERSLVEYLFEGYNFQIYETFGDEAPSLDQMDCASTTFWLHSSDVFNNDSSVLLNFHRPLPNSNQSVIFNSLPSYIQSGGNLLLCGIQPVNALRYIEDLEEGPQQDLQDPVDFCSTLEDPALVPHWAATTLGVCSVENTIPQGFNQPVLTLASSQITGGANPYPDLPFDPLSIPNGPAQGGFRYYDTGIDPAEDAEVIYTDAATGEAVGIRKLSSPGVNGNTIYLGFHPYFIHKSAFREFLRAALTDFGEVPAP